MEIYEELEAQNEKYLEIFLEDLLSSRLASKTVSNHLANVRFFLNNYCADVLGCTMEEGITALDGFLGEFYIRKYLGSTPSTIASTANSIKKFYKSMVKAGNIEKEEYDYLCKWIELGLPDWQETCATYNDPRQPSPFSPFSFFYS